MRLWSIWRNASGLCWQRVRFLAQLSEETKTRILTGPGLDAFVSGRIEVGDAPAVPDHLKRKKGQRLALPSWLKTEIPVGKEYGRLKNSLRELNLNTVCEEARCPNIGECWGGGEEGIATATIMVDSTYCSN